MLNATKKADGLTPMEVLAMVMIASYAHSETGACYPSLSTLASATKMGRRTVVRILARLQARGLLTVQSGTRTSSNRYIVDIDALEALAPGSVTTSLRGSVPVAPPSVTTTLRRDATTPEVVSPRPQGSVPVALHQISDLRSDLRNELPTSELFADSELAPAGGKADEVHEHYLTERRRAKISTANVKLSPKDRQTINRLLKSGETVERLKIAVTWLLHISEHHTGNSKTNSKRFHQLEYALRPKNIDTANVEHEERTKREQRRANVPAYQPRPRFDPAELATPEQIAAGMRSLASTIGRPQPRPTEKKHEVGS